MMIYNNKAKKNKINNTTKIFINKAVEPIKNALAKSTTRLVFKYTKILATNQDIIFIHFGIANSPIVFLSLTKWINGMTAKPNCKLKIT